MIKINYTFDDREMICIRLEIEACTCISQEGTWVGVRILEIAITECQDDTYDLKEKE